MQDTVTASVFQQLVEKFNLIHAYEGNPLVNAMCVGLINHEDIKKGQAHGAGNTVMYVGAKTGRDGIHGATFASEELSESIRRETSGSSSRGSIYGETSY